MRNKGPLITKGLLRNLVSLLVVRREKRCIYLYFIYRAYSFSLLVVGRERGSKLYREPQDSFPKQGDHNIESDYKDKI